jgi:hypothetical protein
MMVPSPSSSPKRSIQDCLAQIDRSRAFRSALMDPSTTLPATLTAPLHDAVSLFTRLNIPYALVGGLAAMIYGRARFTDDVDFVATTSHQQILEANPDAMRACHFDPASTWKLYHDSGIEIDIWKDEHSDEIAARAKTIQLANLPICVADPHDLIAMKLRAHRLQDDYDISEILKHTPIDEPLLQSRITLDQFANFQSIKART